MYHDTQYLDVLLRVLHEGHYREDRTGVGTRSSFGERMSFDLTAGFPLLTTKKLHTRSIFEELIWFLSGDTNNRTLNEKGVHIWDEWADPITGELGPIYGMQWRSFGNNDYNPEGYDQITKLIEGLKNDPYSRRHIVSAWNPMDLRSMALPPCHVMFQFYVTPHPETGDPEGLSCQLYQRSGDLFLGVPFNIASYSLLTHMVAAQVNLTPMKFVHVLGDAHIYNNHLTQVREQLSRRIRISPILTLDPAESIFDYTIDHIHIQNYNPHPTIKAEVAV